MAEDAPRQRRGRGRRPAAEVRKAVLGAAGDLLFEGGVRAVTFERVASRAGSSKMTLYKWWASPGVLALDAYFDRTEEQLSFPDTGDIEADLVTQMTAFLELLGGRGGALIGELVGEAQTDPALAQALQEHYSLPRRQLAVDRLLAAREVGQLRDDLDPSLVVDQLWGACYHRMLLFGEVPAPGAAVRLVGQLLHGIAG